MKYSAIFLDRDGVLIEDTHLITTIDAVKAFPKTAPALENLKTLGFKLIVVTNQSVVSRGLLSLEQALELNQQILKDWPIDASYLCPFHPNATLEKYRQDSELRKPRPGMIIQAAQEYQIDLSKSFMIGDRPSDIVAGNLAGCTTIQVQTGQSGQPMIESGSISFGDKNLVAHYQVNSLWNASILIKGLLNG